MDEPRPAPSWDSALLGFGVAWAMAVLSVAAAWLLGWAWQESLQSRQVYNQQFLLSGTLPSLALIVLLAGSYAGGYRGFARGVLAAFGSMFALLLLLVAACFGAVGLDAF
jgi:hypothetical protein